MVDRITQRSEQVSSQPFSGRKVPEYETEDIRELIEKPYRIIYRLKQGQIDVLAVIHGAQLLPEEIKLLSSSVAQPNKRDQNMKK
jgi:toxin ParE1/3/4